MAPEMYSEGGLGSAAAARSSATDVYSLGIIIWCIYSRKHPFDDVKREYFPGTSADGKCTREFYDLLIKKAGPLLRAGARPDLGKLEPGTPAGAVEWMRRCWDGNAAARPSAAQVYEGFGEALDVSAWGGSGGGGSGGLSGSVSGALASYPAAAAPTPRFRSVGTPAVAPGIASVHAHLLYTMPPGWLPGAYFGADRISCSFCGTEDLLTQGFVHCAGCEYDLCHTCVSSGSTGANVDVGFAVRTVQLSDLAAYATAALRRYPDRIPDVAGTMHKMAEGRAAAGEHDRASVLHACAAAL